MTIPIHVTKRRLLKLAAFLEKLPPERFDYDRWVGNDWLGEPDLSCGTAACALGWATTIPEFRRLGLRLSRCGEPHCGRLYDHAAATEIFGVTENEAAFLFIPDRFAPREWLKWRSNWSPNPDASAKMVARHIRWFVAHVAAAREKAAVAKKGD